MKPSTCNYVLSSDSGEFTSPGYPSKYSDNTTCRWLINATQPIALFFKTNYLQQNVFVTVSKMKNKLCWPFNDVDSLISKIKSFDSACKGLYL